MLPLLAAAGLAQDDGYPTDDGSNREEPEKPAKVFPEWDSTPNPPKKLKGAHFWEPFDEEWDRRSARSLPAPRAAGSASNSHLPTALAAAQMGRVLQEGV